MVLVVAGVLAGCEGELSSLARAFGDQPADQRPEDPLAPGVVPGPAQLRLLNALEYRHTVEDLLGLSVTAPLSHGDWAAGFDSGAGGQVQDSLLGVLLDEAQALGGRYVATRASADFPCFDPADVTDACIDELISRLGRRAWRRPLTGDERAALRDTFRAASALGTRVDGAAAVVARLLLAPQLLYRSEIGKGATPGSAERVLDAFERATLVSYALTAAPPDDPLLDEAEAGTLDEAALQRHVRRLWTTPRARARMADVMRQWLGLGTLDDLATRPQDFPKLTTAEAGPALRREFDESVQAVLFEGDGTLASLLASPVAVVNRYTAPAYGLTVSGDASQRVELPAAQRRGVLTLASTMSALSSAGDVGRDRPVLRGLMVKARVLCEEVGPPSGVNTVAAANTAMSVPNFDQLTTRQQYEAMMEQGAECAACHAQFMPLGFSFGSYDALGHFRTSQRGRPIDTRALGVPLLGTTQDLSDALALSDFLANHEATALCFTRQLVAYTTGVARTQYADELAALLHHRTRAAPLQVGALLELALTSPAVFSRVAVSDAAPPPTGGGGGGGGAPTGGGTMPTGGGGGGAMTPGPATVLLSSGASLGPSGSRRSSDGAFNLLYQLDGNLVLYRAAGGAVWASGTVNTRPRTTAMQGDGNLVIYDEAGAPVWHTRTHGNPGAFLAIEASGRLSVRTPGGAELWSSTGGMP